MKNVMTKKHEHADLELLYSEAEQCDAEIFAEMRSNLLLVSGEHYNRRQSNFFKRIRDNKELSEQQKLRLTKNHIQKIVKTYANNIISMAPGVGFAPANETEIQDQKTAELTHAVWLSAKEKYGLDESTDDWCDDFVQVGEAITKIFFDPMGGELKGHRAQMDDQGNLLFDEQGQMVPGEPVYAGEFVFEQVHGFNLLRAPQAKTMKASPHLIIRKMVDVDELKAKFSDKEQMIQESEDSTLVVFDAGQGGYRKAKGETLLKEYYFRPCPLYPKGFFYFSTKQGILAEGELPGGVFPIVVQPFEKIQTTPRGRSPVKVMRPYQAEINRSASKMAEHQITLGDDKLLIQNGTKISAGVALPGVRSINYTGMAPDILAGRAGSQYLEYMQSQIAELYDVMNVAEDSVEKNGQLDPYALLFRSASKKKHFQRYIKRFERFLVSVAKTYISLAKVHLPDDAVILCAGRKEAVNISEFRNSSELCYQIKVEPQSDDVETKLGKQLALNHALQYVSAKLDKEDIGKIMRAMPYGNFEESFSDLTLDYDAASNDILALDRGEVPQVNAYDNHVYLVKRLVARMRQADFKYLDPQLQANYEQVKQLHQQAEVERLRAIQAAEAGFIPTGGYMVTCDLYVADGANPEKAPKRARIPYEALTWLIKNLETQGQSLEELEKMNQGAVAQMAQMLLQRKSADVGNGIPASVA